MTIRPVQPSLIDGYPDRPVGSIPPSVMGGTNSDLMAAIAPLYLTGSVMDVTYGRGGWWQRFTPDPFIKHDRYTLDGVDFRALPEADRSVDTVCFDPPYVHSGGAPTNATAANHRKAYGIEHDNAYPSERELFAAAEAGLVECCRVARRLVLVKCMEFVGSATFTDIPTRMTNLALAEGCKLHDRIVHHTGSGPGGHNIFDVKRARRHHSYLLVFAVPS